MADLVIIGGDNRGKEDKVNIAVEFKYEPDHKRAIKRPFSGQGILDSKFSVVQKSDVDDDIEKVKGIVIGKDKKTGIDYETVVDNAYVILIDEGGHHYSNNKKGFEDLGGKWKEWPGGGKAFVFKTAKVNSDAPDIFPENDYDICSGS